MSNAIGSSRESNPSRRICHLRAVPLGHVAARLPINEVRAEPRVCDHAVFMGGRKTLVGGHECSMQHLYIPELYFLICF